MSRHIHQLAGWPEFEGYSYFSIFSNGSMTQPMLLG